MRRFVFITFFALASFMTLFSCKEGNGRKNMLSAVSGSTNELMVIIPKALWEGQVGDTIKQFFGQDQLGLPQSEPVFDLISLPPAHFEKNVRLHRNVLLVSINSKADSASLVYFDSPWARSQRLFKIIAPNAEEFYKIFDANKEKMMNVYLNAERDRLLEVYKKTPNEKVFNMFKDKYHVLLYCPGGYNINKDTNNFVWVSSETRVDSKGFMFFEEPYTHESQLNYQVILERVNEELEKYIPGPRDSTWMSLDMVTPMTAATYHYQGVYYAVLVKGLWTVVNDFMGGPFVLNVVLDEKNNRVIYMIGYVYAPDGKKRNMLRQVESILFSLQPDIPEEGKK